MPWGAQRRPQIAGQVTQSLQTEPGVQGPGEWPSSSQYGQGCSEDGSGRDPRSLASGEAGPAQDDPAQVQKERRVRNRQGQTLQPGPACCPEESSVNPNRSRQPLRGAVYEMRCVGSKQQKSNLPHSNRSGGDGEVIRKHPESKGRQALRLRKGQEPEPTRALGAGREASFFRGSPLRCISHNCSSLLAPLCS